MNKITLQEIVEHYTYDDLSMVWRGTALKPFSNTKTMYPYQIKALQNAIIALKLYYQQNNEQADNLNHTDLPKMPSAKVDFTRRYFNKGLKSEWIGKQHITPKAKRYHLLTDYYPIEQKINVSFINFINFINRMSFWMATGSGKSLVILKLMEVLADLIKYDEIPNRNILFLTHKQDLINQLKEHAKEFNEYLNTEKDYEIVFRDLREFPEFEYRSQTAMFGGRYINIFYYRSDLLDEAKKDNQVNFREYVNNGKWYVFLDEAHRGKTDDSIKKQYINILSQNGFIFNFSATFTDEVDLLSTVYNFNLSEFIKAGYGKHLYIAKTEFSKTFKKIQSKTTVEDYTEEEKQKIVLMSLILLAYIKKRYLKIKAKTSVNIYHNPLLLTLVNSVNKPDSDLLLFFKELEKIAKGEIKNDLFNQACNTLKIEFTENSSYVFNDTEKLNIGDDIANINLDDVLIQVFNTNKKGEFEVMRNPKNKKELSFSVKSSDQPTPFALLKIGNTDKWVKEILADYQVEEDYADTKVFETLNESSVNILMGSRAFYEGWDSNRPNIINFINIGTSKDAKKFILQSTGRGVRIEPVKNQRKRLKSLPEAIEKNNLTAIIGEVKPIETLFIFGTKRSAIQSVLTTLEEFSRQEIHHLNILQKTPTDKILYVPVYKQVAEQHKTKVKKYALNTADDELLSDIMQTMDDETAILNYGLAVKDFRLLQNRFKNRNTYFSTNGDQKIGKPNLLLKNLINYFKIIPEELDTFVEVGDKINHYQHIKVSLPEVAFEELKQSVEKVIAYNGDNKAAINQLAKKLQANEIDMVQFQKEYETLSSGKEQQTFLKDSNKLVIKNIKPYFYIPMIMSDSDKIRWINHIIDEKSEVEFIKELEMHLQKQDNLFAGLDWWMFSKIDHTLDKNIRIPYIDLASGEKRNFLPDFVFWIAKDTQYYIVFVDPKGTGRMEYQYKVDGFKALFEQDGKPKIFEQNGYKISVQLKLFTADANVFTDANSYKSYWFDSANFDRLVELTVTTD